MFIYLIVNHITGKYYVGQHKGNNLRKYLQKKLWAAKHKVAGSSHLFNSMRKHPKNVWSIHALLSDVQTRPALDQYERDFILFLKSQDPEYGYNICRGGEGFTGPHSPKTRRKMSKTRKAKMLDPEQLAKQRAAFDNPFRIARCWDPEVRARANATHAITNTGSHWGHHSEDSKAKIAAKLAGNKNGLGKPATSGGHIQWHVKRGIVKPDCPFCN